MTVSAFDLPAVPAGRYRAIDVMRSEWTKLRTVRSTTWSLVATLVLTVGIGIVATALVAWRWPHLDAGFRETFDPVRQSLTGLLFGQLALGVLGVLVVSSEYSSGSIRATLTASPNRPLLLAAKTAVFGTVALVFSEVLMFATYFIGQAILTGQAPHAALGQPGVARAVIGGGIYITLLALIGMGLAAIIRHTAGAISVFEKAAWVTASRSPPCSCARVCWLRAATTVAVTPRSDSSRVMISR